MEDTSIVVKADIKEMIREFGNEGESYSDIILKLISCARERQFYDLLMNEEDSVSIDLALENAKKQWLD